jgi:4-hydroxythreonine-4-phosphate dehydrogenase
MRRAVVAVSVGCPSGVGPEVAVLAAARSTQAACVLVGDEEVIRRAARLRRVAAKRLVRVDDRRAMQALRAGEIGVFTGSTRMRAQPAPGRPSAEAGAAQLAWINEAAALVREGSADALATGPVSKHAIATSGAEGAADFLGHTEHLARLFRAREVVMAFWGPELCTSLVTTHIPLAEVPRAVTKEGVASSAYWLARLLRDLGAARPRLAIAAMNPHAGEGGLLGHEEEERIAPGIRLARRRLARARVSADLAGPLGAETAFRLAASRAYDGVVAMYHDQATIPSKLLGFGDAVNVTLGLPIIRTSVDHGTAYDLAGTGRADARGMAAALDLAVRLAEARCRP